MFKKILFNFVFYNRKICLFLNSKFSYFFVGKKNFNNDYLEIINNIIESNNIKNVLELGGIDRPTLSKNKYFIYDGLDIEDKLNCYNVYDNFFVQSVEDPFKNKYDLVISKFLIEHVKDNKKTYRNIFNALNKDGHICILFPLKNHFYSIILRIVGNRLQKLLIRYLRPHAQSTTGYPAYFNLCSKSEVLLELNKLGYSEISFKLYYKATDYFSFLVPLYMLISLFENFFELFNFDKHAAYIIVHAKK